MHEPESSSCDPRDGHIVWNPLHSLWNGGMMAAAILFGPATVSWSGLGAALLLGALSMLGFSVGLHRHYAHAAFECGVWTGRVLAWLGVLTGIDGPIGMVRAHHLSDWAQQRDEAYDFFTHRRSWLTHMIWRAHGRIVLQRAPVFDLGRLQGDPMIRLLDRTWMLQQVVLAVPLYAVGGWPLVVWGVPVRVMATVTAYWTLAHLAHRPNGHSARHKPGNDVGWAAVLTLGEAWHSNHHAWPSSAKIGLHPGQSDWGWRFIQLLERLGLAWNVRTPETMVERRAALAEAGR